MKAAETRQKGAQMPLLQYIKEPPDAHLREIAEHFGCVIATVHSRLKKFGITYKKRELSYKDRSFLSNSLIFQVIW
ncbi:MAG: transposase [Holosporaceae bacterium]|nr:transposase [Holosporaceae bacterium]